MRGEEGRGEGRRNKDNEGRKGRKRWKEAEREEGGGVRKIRNKIKEG